MLQIERRDDELKLQFCLSSLTDWVRFPGEVSMSGYSRHFPEGLALGRSAVGLGCPEAL